MGNVCWYSYDLLLSFFSQSSDRLSSQPPAFPSDTSTGRLQPQHTAYILQPPSNPSNNSSRNRVRDRKHQSTLRQNQKSTSTSNTMLDDQSQLQFQQPSAASSSSSSANMRSLDRRHVRPAPHNASINSTIAKTPMKSSHTDIYGSLERNKHSKVSQPTLHGTILNEGNDRGNKADQQAHDFYHLTSTVPSASTANTSTIVNVGNALQQQHQQSSFDQIDSVPPPLPPSTHRSRRAPPSVFQPHFDSSTSTASKDSYYTISGSKDVSTHPHHIRGLLADHFYNGPYSNKPPAAPPQQQQSMHRYDTSPLLVRRVDQPYPAPTQQQQQQQQQTQIPRYPSQPYNRTQSSSLMTTSQPSSGRLSNPNNITQPSALLFRPHSSQSSSSQSSGYSAYLRVSLSRWSFFLDRLREVCMLQKSSPKMSLVGWIAIMETRLP